MKKIHTKIKRKFELSTCKRQYRFFHPQAKSHRAKTFTSESLAKEWIKQHGTKEGEDTLKLVKRNKRYEIVSKKQ
jgi:hypothetical protein